MGTYLLAVETAAGELLIPFAAHICTEIDLASRRIVVSLPEGLRESQ
jgi:ribosomal 30S subunit maturation factor RimM